MLSWTKAGKLSLSESSFLNNYLYKSFISILCAKCYSTQSQESLKNYNTLEIFVFSLSIQPQRLWLMSLWTIFKVGTLHSWLQSYDKKLLSRKIKSLYKLASFYDVYSNIIGFNVAIATATLASYVANLKTARKVLDSLHLCRS